MHFSGELLRPTSASHGTVPPSEPATRGRPTVLFWPPNPKACPASCRTSVISTFLTQNSFADTPSKIPSSIPLSQRLTSPPKCPATLARPLVRLLGSFRYN